MKLSEAMRLGAMLKPQGFTLWRTADTACALDAVALATGTKVTLLYHAFRILDRRAICADSCGDTKRFDLGTMIVHLNDDHRWTRERIADWIEAEFESSFDQAPPAAPERLGLDVEKVET